MPGIIPELFLSWMLLWLLQKQSLTVLGLLPRKRRLRALILGFALAGMINAVYHIATACVVKRLVYLKDITHNVYLPAVRKGQPRAADWDRSVSGKKW